jgi:hypothetical protein
MESEFRTRDALCQFEQGTERGRGRYGWDMRPRSNLVLGGLILTLALAGCATASNGAGVAVSGAASEAVATSTPTVSESPEDVAAREQAQSWLDAAALPPGAVRSEASIGGFGSYTGWPCGPYQEIEAFWSIPGATVADTANWLREHPTANLITTALGPAPDDPTFTSAIVGYIPAQESQEGIVYTIEKSSAGVVVRAEVAAQTASATCPPLPDGGKYGAPGQG